MDAKEYDRIADLLMQIRKKYRKLGQSINNHCVTIDDTQYSAMDLISLLLRINDNLGEADAMGWL